MRIVLAGARGEVGASLAESLVRLGHEILPVSARAPLPDDPGVLTLDAARSLIGERAVDAVVNAAGKGDRRPTNRSGQESTSVLASAVASAGVPSVLISTMRVAEGHAQAPHDDLSARPATPYAQANAENERAWLEAGGGTVLRLVNYLCPPAAADSPQALLLPWSLVVDGARDRRIDVRSGPSEAKEFVNADDAAAACLMLLEADSPPSIVSTVPGALFTMRSMAMTAADALAAHGFVRPEISFGPDGDGVGLSHPGWLAAQGWAVSLSTLGLSSMVSTWVGDRKTGLLEVSR